ncbi:MAG: AzlC family ABC transporter permease [Chloroflexi bacterium]|nr:AzlC family ABC transporter permease [Chloroflexota bacterium]
MERDGGTGGAGRDPVDGHDDLRVSRRRLLAESAGIALSSGGFGLVYGLAARHAGFSPAEAIAMSVLVFAGASQFAAVGLAAGGLAWPAIMLLTALLNARHLIYSAALAPWFRDLPRGRRAAAAYVLTDESFALGIAHFQRIGSTDERGYWIGALASTWIPWNVMTAVGAIVGGQIADPTRFGLDAVFPAAMAGLAVGLLVGRRELVAAVAGACVAVALGLALGTAVAVVAGGLIGPVIAIALFLPRGEPESRAAASPDDLLRDAREAAVPPDEAGLP